MKKLLFLWCALAPAQGVLTLTVCGSGCNHTTIADGVTAAVAAQATTCAPVIVEIALGTYDVPTYPLPTKACRQYIEIRGAGWRSLPSGRATAADVASMPTLQPAAADSSLPIFTIPAGSYYRIRGLRFKTRNGGSLLNYRLIEVGTDGQLGESNFPTGIQIVQSLIHGVSLEEGPVRGIYFASCKNCEVSDSSIYEVKATADSQAILCRQCVGLTVRNSLLEASGMSYMSGGTANSGMSDIPTPGLTQAVRFLGNMMTKRPEWRRTESASAPTGACLSGSYHRNTTTNQWHLCTAGTWGTAGSGGTGVPFFAVKNIWEAKDGGGVVVGNLLDISFQQAQNGYGVLGNQTGDLPNYALSLDVRFNRIRRTTSAIATGRLGIAQPRSLVFEHNNLEEVGPSWGNVQPQITRAFSLHGFDWAAIRRNTVHFSPGAYVHSWLSVNCDVAPCWGDIDVSENVLDGINWLSFAPQDLYGFAWFGPGASTICTFQSAVVNPGRVIRADRNHIVAADSRLAVGACPAQFPSSNTLRASLASMLANPNAGNYAVLPGDSAKAAAADGGDIGADQGVVTAMTAQAISGAPNGFLDAGIRSAFVVGSTATVRYTMPSAPWTCTPAVSVLENFTPVGSVSTTVVGRSAAATITNATGARWARITCSDGSQTVNMPAERI